MEKIEKKKTFAAALSHSIPSAKPSAWESYLLQELKKLQGAMADMKKEIIKKDEQISELQTQMQAMKTQQQEAGEGPMTETLQTEMTNHVLKVNSSNSAHFVKEVISVIKEKERVEGIQNQVRIGGLPLGWDRENIALELEDDYVLETDVLKAQLSKVVPFVDLGEPTFIIVKGTQAKVSYWDKSEKIAVMKQTRSLQGTKVWIADELTPLQLKNRPAELAKVKEARKNGKWAVYRGGKAIIGEFHTPPPKGVNPPPT